MTGRYVAALSEHPLATQAIGEVAGEVLERLGPAPDLAVLFVTPPHLGALEDMAAAVRSVLQPAVLMGAGAVAVVGPGREVEETAGVSLFAARLSSRPVPLRLTAEASPDGWRINGIPAELGPARSLVLIADPFTFPVDSLLESLRADHPNVAVVGGMASAASGPGGNRLLLDGGTHAHGAVGALLSEDVAPQSVVSQGCRPIGRPFIVTRAERNVIYELAGKPALERLMAMLESLGPDDRKLAAQGLHCGIVVDESKATFERGDFLIRGVLGADREAGAVAVGQAIDVGSTVQFQVRDADSADEDLHEMLGGRTAGGALVFTCNGRGLRLFGVPDHDATVVGDMLDTTAVAGMFCAGEFGPVGGRNAVHGFTASIALFQ